MKKFSGENLLEDSIRDGKNIYAVEILQPSCKELSSTCIIILATMVFNGDEITITKYKDYELTSDDVIEDVSNAFIDKLSKATTLSEFKTDDTDVDVVEIFFDICTLDENNIGIALTKDEFSEYVGIFSDGVYLFQIPDL